MLRSNAEVAINDLIVAARESADLYADDAELVEQPELARLFEDLAARRQDMYRTLSEHVRRRGDLPPQPDTDRETLLRLGKRVKAALSPDEREALLEDRLQAETELEHAVTEALEHQSEPETRRLLGTFHRDIGAARRRLEALRATQPR